MILSKSDNIFNVTLTKSLFFLITIIQPLEYILVQQRHPFKVLALFLVNGYNFRVLFRSLSQAMRLWQEIYPQDVCRDNIILLVLMMAYHGSLYNL